MEKLLPAHPWELDHRSGSEAQRGEKTAVTSLLTLERIFFNWARLPGSFVQAMQRPWHDEPTVLISFGHPFYLMDAPRMPCVVNAYATMDTMQEAALGTPLEVSQWGCLTGHNLSYPASRRRLPASV